MSNQTMTQEEVARVIKEVLIKEARASISVDEMTDILEFTPDGFGIDSLTFIRSIVSLEETLGIEVGDGLLLKFKIANVGELVQYISNIYAQQSADPAAAGRSIGEGVKDDGENLLQIRSRKY